MSLNPGLDVVMSEPKVSTKSVAREGIRMLATGSPVNEGLGHPKKLAPRQRTGSAWPRGAEAAPEIDPPDFVASPYAHQGTQEHPNEFGEPWFYL
jgi:hypothetical protein